MTAPPDNIPRSLHDIWYAGHEAGFADGCRATEAHQQRLIELGHECTPFVSDGPNFIYTNEHGDRFKLIVTGDRAVPFVVELQS